MEGLLDAARKRYPTRSSHMSAHPTAHGWAANPEGQSANLWTVYPCSSPLQRAMGELFVSHDLICRSDVVDSKRTAHAARPSRDPTPERAI